MTSYDIAYIVGSNSRESINRKLAGALVKLAPPSLSFREVEIENLPLYNRDFEGARPERVDAFTAKVRSADGLMIVMPEHNRSLPAVLKNAIDWGSKPADQNVWRDKPTFITGTSPGAIGTAVGQQHLRQILGAVSGIVLGGECYLQFKPELIDADGNVTVESTRKFLAGHLARFADLVPKLASR
ncbi:chromate reductase [Panacagrimonas perspica]|uniref:Chromate reductase n=1 Tax=Panacagrimonas perspica TaxID=381431 RepID=A0A4R7P1A5_9GAMM|nr:NADPH-dependent FMN reductase [Panacagrimonas perspica]TDU26861.1 chromate reductase [Panacagrimonas perspica]THD03631.1 ACP phosphodiesterase [Panacagrimonas perspica]